MCDRLCLPAAYHGFSLTLVIDIDCLRTSKEQMIKLFVQPSGVLLNIGSGCLLSLSG
jgi:hypothetical protein